MHTTTQLAAQAARSSAPGARVAHAALFERVMERIHRYFRRMLRNPSDAEDCLQRTLILLEESLSSGKYEPDRSFNAWMWLKAHTVFAQWCREHQRAPGRLPEQELTAPATDHAATIADQLDAGELLQRVRDELGEEVYEAFVLYYEGGITQAEVSEALQRDRKTIRKRITQAHQLIDRYLRN